MEPRMLKYLMLMLIGMFLTASVAKADQDNFLVLGIIASTDNQQGVALMKNVVSGKTFAARVGTEFSKASILRSVNRKTVEIKINGKVYILRVGDETASAQIAFASVATEAYTAESFERSGDTVKVSASLRDHIVNNKLADVLMQAAAVPYMSNGALAGFTLWDIEPKSVFELAGLKNGDTILAINGQQINDVGSTIRLLNSLRKQNQAMVDFLRNGQPQKINLMIQ